MARTRKTSAVSAGDGIKAVRPAGLDSAPAVEDAIAPDRDDFGTAHLAAIAQANAALMEGLEAIGATVYAYARASLGSATSAARSLIDARSLVDVVALHQDFTQTAIEELIASAGRVAEIGVRATGEAFKPLGEHVADTMSKLKRTAKP